MSNHPEFYEASNFTKNLACSGLSEVESAIVKATFEDDSVPKEKHVISLLRLSDFDTSFFTPLFRRISTRNYRVVFKTLLVFHRLTRDGPLHNIKALETKTQFFSQLCNYQSRDSPVHARIIRLYSAYYVEKINSYACSKRSAERDSPADAKVWAMQLPLKEVLVLLPALQKQMDKLLLVDPGVPFIDPNIRYFFNLLLRDSMRLYNVCNIFIYHNLKQIDSMDRTQTAIFLQCCRNSLSIDERYITWHKTLNRVRLATESLPAFQKLPENIFTLLEQQLADLDHQAGLNPGDGNRLTAEYTISSTKGQVPTASTATPAFHNDKMAAPTPTATVGGNLGAKTGYSNQKPTNAGSSAQKTQSIDEFTFDAFNDSEWSFDNNAPAHNNNNNNNNNQHDPFASPQVQNNNFNTNTQRSPHPQQQQQQQPQPQPQQQTQSPQPPRNNDPFAAFDAFNDAIPVQQTTQIKTSTTGNNTNVANNTQSQINSMYNSPTISNTGMNNNNQPFHSSSPNNGFNTNTNMNNNMNNGYQPQHRASTAAPPPYDDDPFSGLVNNNTTYQQPAMVVMAAPMYQPMYTNGYQQPSMMQQPYPNQQQWNNGGGNMNNGMNPNMINQQQYQQPYNNNNNNLNMNINQQQQQQQPYNNNNMNHQQQYNNSNNNNAVHSGYTNQQRTNNNNNNNAFDLPF